MGSDNEREFDIIIYGASGYTGKYVVEYVAKIYEEEKLKWAIAGRDAGKLKGVLEDVSTLTGKDVKDIPVFSAAVSDSAALAEVCKKTKVLLNCVGPFRLYGEPVVKACIDNGCHHIDISGEPVFLESMQVKYHEEAQKAKVYVLGAAGVDSIPCETGIQFLTEKFNGDVNSVETFLDIKSGPKGYSGNIGTWLSAVHGVANRKELRSLRTQIFSKPVPRSNHKLKNRGVMSFANEVKQWCLAFPVTDKSVVNRTTYYNYHNRKMRPIQMYSYLVLPTIWYGLVWLLVGLCLGILSNFKFGRYCLENFPSIFSFGIFSKSGPTREQVKETSFSLYLVGRGYDEKLAEPEDQHATPPNKTLVVRVDAPDPGYVGTSMFMVQVALTLLQELDKLPDEGGVLTPGAALLNTSLISRLIKQGINYSIVSS